MIDTIRLQYPINVDTTKIQSWSYHRASDRRGYHISYVHNHGLGNEMYIYYKYQPCANNGEPLLDVEFSLPQVVLGSNVYMIYNIGAGVSQANELLPIIPGIPELNLWVGILRRLDVCYNYQVGDLVQFYIDAFQKLRYPYRKTQPYPTGVEFYNGQASLKFYDKAAYELSKKRFVLDASDILRQETTLRFKKVKEVTGKNNPTLLDINNDMLLDFQENELRQLELLGRSIGTYDIALGQLCEAFGKGKGPRYFGLLMANMKYPSLDDIATAIGCTKQTIERSFKKITKAGIPLTITKADEPLPPLVIDREEVKRMENAEFAENLGVIPIGYILDGLQQLPMDKVGDECVGK